MAGFPYKSITPFLSLTLATHANKETSQNNLTHVLADLRVMCEDDQQSPATRFVEGAMRRIGAGGAFLKAAHYSRRDTPSWAGDSNIVDIENHLLIALVLNQNVVLHFTDPRLRGPIKSALAPDADAGHPLSWLSAIPRSLMSAAFLENGQARTLWLSGTHRRSALKADAKILSGVDLDYALDPFDDQSFYWSAARSHNYDLNIVVGVSPSASRVWLRKSKDIDDYGAMATDVLKRIAAAKKGKGSPFRYLASPLETVDVSAIRSAFDLSLIPPDLVEEDEEGVEQSRVEAAVIYETTFEVTKGAGASFSAAASRNGNPLGSFRVNVSLDSTGKATFAVAGLKPAEPKSEAFDIIVKRVSQGDGVNVRYDSGHSISHRQVFAMRQQRIDFSRYLYTKFDKTNVTQEKPKKLNEIGQHDSLFCWVQHNFKGWLACDDGSMEKADFIHIDLSGKTPVLSLIHVKGAHSASATRQISVAAYEVVTAQAVKNLLWLNKEELAAGIAKVARAANHFWKDGKPTNKQAFISALEALPGNLTRRVIVLQPHLTKSMLEKVQQQKIGADRLRLDQLNTLLASAERSCNGLGVEFQVICAE